MKKDAYYFSHDANAQDDPKCMHLIDELGMEGYGIFWALIERLRCEKNFILPYTIVLRLAKRWFTTEEKVKSVINDYGLFVIQDDHFFSERLKKSMDEKTQKARKSVSYRWNNTDVIRPNNERNTDDIRNDTIKGKESKRKRGNSSNDENNTKPGAKQMVW